MLGEAIIDGLGAGAGDPRRGHGTGGDDDLHLGYDRQAEGRGPAYATDQETGVALLGLLGYRPDDIYITSGPLYHSGPSAFMGASLLFGQTIVVQRKFDAEDWLRLSRQVQGVVDLLRAGADPHGVRAARRGQGHATTGPPCASCSRMRRRGASRSSSSTWPTSRPSRCGRSTARPSWAWTACWSPRIRCASQGRAASQRRASRSCSSTRTGTTSPAPGPSIPASCIVRSNGVFNEYYKQQDSYDASSRGDFHTVGDIAYWDDEGYLYICDRKTDMIISGGMNIYPAEIEAALEQHPAIYDVAVFGIPSEEWGEVVHATIVLAPGAIADRGGHQGVRQGAPGQLQGAAVGRLPRGAAADRLGQDPQAAAPRAPYWAGRTAQVG